MAGIAGIVYPDLFQMSHLVDTMLNLLEPRGPEDKNSHSYKSVEMGICGGELTCNDHRTIWAMFDGTIFNLEELRKQIKEAGYSADNDSATTLLIHAYELWGREFIEKLNGSFAIVIFDHKKQRLFLIRDRIGKKPLYWAHVRNHFVFASEIKAILSTGIIPQSPADDAIAAYLFLGYVPQDMTPIKGLNKLLPSYYLEYNLQGEIAIRPYWSYSSYFSKHINHKEDEILSNLHDLLDDAVKIRTPADKPVACLVGGGLGSATIAHYLSKNTPKENINTYSVAFAKENCDDLLAAQSAMNALGLAHESESLTTDSFFSDLIRVIWTLDEPIADPHVIATWHQCRMAVSNTDTILSGMGSDELLGGHLRYQLKTANIAPSKLLSLIPNSFLDGFVVPFVRHFHQKTAFNMLRHFHTHPQKLSFFLQNAIFDPKTLSQASPSLSHSFNPTVFLQKFYHLDHIHSELQAFLYLDVKTSLPDKFLLQYERIATAHGLSWRTPFLDHRLIEYLAGITDLAKLHEGQTALILKNLVKDFLPPEFIKREKASRPNFFSSWRKNPIFTDIVPFLENGILVESGYITKKWLKSRKVRFAQLWSLLNLEIWFQLFINTPITVGSAESPLSNIHQP